MLLQHTYFPVSTSVTTGVSLSDITPGVSSHKGRVLIDGACHRGGGVDKTSWMKQLLNELFKNYSELMVHILAYLELSVVSHCLLQQVELAQS